jgi:Cytochrome P450
MSSFFLVLALFPQVQRRAQAELDVVVGRDRLPALDDRPRLPYIEALCKELTRWLMVTPIGTIRGLLWLSKTEMTNDDLQESPICQLGMMFTEAISFRKVRLIFNCVSCFFFGGGDLPLILWSKRIYHDSQCMVSRLVVL